MDLSEFEPRGRDQLPESEDDPDDDAEGYALLGRMSGEIAAPLTAALDRVRDLAATGRIERRALRALHAEVAGARRAAMIGQQLARHACGRVRQSHERVDLAAAVRDVLARAQGRGPQVRHALEPADVVVDPTLLHALLEAAFEWAFGLARSPIDVRLERRPWPHRAHLTCRFRHHPPDQACPDPDATRDRVDTLTWRLAQGIATSMGLVVERRDDATATVLDLGFPRTVNEQLEGLSAIELDAGAGSEDAKTLAGAHVLVLAARGDVRRRVREAIAHMGLLIDFATTVDEARAFCDEGLPHALVHVAAVRGDGFDELCRRIRSEAPDFAFVEVVDDSHAFEFSGSGGVARVGLDALAARLPAVLACELSKNL